MEMVWSVLENKRISELNRKHLFLFLNSLLFGILGFGVWLVVSRFTLATIDWMLCFIGYPGFFFGFIGGFIFLCKK